MALPLAPFLISLAWPIAKKVLLALGIGMITYGGLSLIAGQVVTQVQAYWGQMPISILQIGSLLGIPQSIGILLGAITARVSFVAAGKLGKIAS